MQTETINHTDQQEPHRLTPWIISLVITCVALAPRVIGLADFFTIDEPYHWIGRVERFSQALANSDWAATNQTGHPGVTIMWLGSLGRWLAGYYGVVDPGWAGGGASYLGWLRLPVAIVNSLIPGLAYLLLRRLVRPSIALAAGLLWATSPFLVAHGRLLHLDATVTSLITLSLLLLIRAVIAPRAWPWLIGAGGMAGLALLTKGPSFILLPVTGMIVLLGQWLDGPNHHTLSQRLWRVMHHGSIWLISTMVVFWIGWPAMWREPIVAFGAVVNEVIGNGGQEHHAGNYFLGQPMGDPGPLFYPAVILWHTTPWTLFGLILFGFSWRVHRANHPWPHERRALLLLLLFALVFSFFMSALPKKFDRYLLPIWPTLEILAASGYVWAWAWIRQRRISLILKPWMATLGWTGVSGLLLLNLAWYHPYTLAYFNPLLGGGTVAQRVMLVGWGEGMEQVGAWLRQRPDLGRGPVLSWMPPTLAPFIPSSTLVLDLRPQLAKQASSYVVLYARSVQRKESAEAEAIARANPALDRLQAYGIEYASIHQITRPFTIAITATFDDAIQLRGYSLQHLNNTLVITPSWSIINNHRGGAFVFLHLLNSQGQRVAQIDAPLDQGMFRNWQAGQQFDGPLPLTLPDNLAAGQYTIALGLYQPENGARYRLSSGQPLAEHLAGPDAIPLATWDAP